MKITMKITMKIMGFVKVEHLCRRVDDLYKRMRMVHPPEGKKTGV